MFREEYEPSPGALIRGGTGEFYFVCPDCGEDRVEPEPATCEDGEGDLAIRFRRLVDGPIDASADGPEADAAEAALYRVGEALKLEAGKAISSLMEHGDVDRRTLAARMGTSNDVLNALLDGTRPFAVADLASAAAALGYRASISAGGVPGSDAADRVERAAAALCRWVFPGYAVPRHGMAAAALAAADDRRDDWLTRLPAKQVAVGEPSATGVRALTVEFRAVVRWLDGGPPSRPSDWGSREDAIVQKTRWETCVSPCETWIEKRTVSHPERDDVGA